MKVRFGIYGGALIAALALSACARGDDVPDLMNIRSQSRSPDEFAILPTKPLTLPEDVSVLPAPTPGGSNITDPSPEADAIAALGGNPDAVKAGKISTSSSALVAHASRFGTASDIRTVLAAEDLEYRRQNDGRLLERLFNVNIYYKAYTPQALDQYAELDRWRKIGLPTVSAPPDGLEAE